MQNDRSKFKNDFKTRLYKFVLRLVKYIAVAGKDTASQVMAKQLMRSGSSVLANYVEASAASSKKDFTNFFNHSLKSANESKVWVALLRDSGLANELESNWLINELNEIANILAKSILTLKNK